MLERSVDCHMYVTCVLLGCQPFVHPLQEITSGEITTYFARDEDSGAGGYVNYEIRDVSLIFMTFKLLMATLFLPCATSIALQ